MKAAFLVRAGELEIREVPDPVPSDGGLVLEVEACGVCGSDLRRWKEGPPAGVEGIVPGHEVAGLVVEIGKNVAQYVPGDRLAVAPDIHCGQCYYCQRGMFNLCDDLRYLGISPGYPGGFAEKMALTDEVLANGIVHRIPDGLSFTEAALAEPCSSVLAVHHKAGTSLNDTVVVIGAGPTGCLHIVIAKARGARVIVSQRSATRRALAQRFKPDAVVDPINEDLTARVDELTGGLGADIVICANPVATTQAQAVEVVRKAGRVVLFGGLPKADPMTTLDGNRIHYGEIEVVGAFSYHPTFHALALEVLERKLIPTDLLITHTFALEKVREAFQTAASGEGLKVMVEPS
ncbi:MAG: alcohol dehydrogenase catalytic domain-containing protein [Anaerolineae bacterium]|nr:MAG: alcohol dehydrogenase catalytic domain-containing protein [Anaerolineae bacterium]